MKAFRLLPPFLLAAVLLFSGCIPQRPGNEHVYYQQDISAYPAVSEVEDEPTHPIALQPDSPLPELEPAQAPAPAPDFDAISQLSYQAHGWGHGGPIDDRNRSQGALLFQERYARFDAHFIKPDSNRIYLTFDQGWEHGFTPVILDTLKEKDVPGAFFLTMHFARSHPDLVQRMIDEGHVLANHSTAHRNFPSMTLQDAADDVMQLHEFVRETFGYEMHLFRFPEGSFSEQTLALLQSLGYKSVFWSFAYRDWEIDNQPLTIDAVNRMTSSAHPGAIYLLHSVSRTNAEVLGEVIDLLRAQGFEFGRLEL